MAHDQEGQPMHASPTVPPFSAYRVAGDLVFTSGQVALLPGTPLTPGALRPVSEQFETQAHVCLDALETLLVQAGSSLNRVLRIECFLRDPADLPAWNAIFIQRFEPQRPARSTLIASPPLPGFLIEVQAIAQVGDRHGS